MRELDGGALVVEADVGFLARAEGAVDDGGLGAVGKLDERHRHVFDFDRAVEGGGHGANFGPIAEQVEEMIHRVDAQAHSGSAEFGGPFAAPGHCIISGVAEPDSITDGDERAAEEALVGEAAQVRGR